MKFLLDICVICESVSKKPNKKVLAWLESKAEEDLFLSVLTIGEIQKGISRLSGSSKRLNLQKWLDQELKNRFEDRIVDLDIDVMDSWGRMLGEAEQNGLKYPVIDSLLAATAITYGFTFVTRNEKDVNATGVRIRNPWL